VKNDMAMPTIPHAREVYEVRDGSAPPALHIVTDLMHDSASPGFDAAAHEEMMSAIRALMGLHLGEQFRSNWACFVIHSPDQSWGPR
jgi:hypothetical protein